MLPTSDALPEVETKSCAFDTYVFGVAKVTPTATKVISIVETITVFHRFRSVRR